MLFRSDDSVPRPSNLRREGLTHRHTSTPSSNCSVIQFSGLLPPRRAQASVNRPIAFAQCLSNTFGREMSLTHLPTSILLQIFDHLRPSWTGWTSRNGAPELVALAVTCQRLSEHALTTLWKEPPSLLPLVMTLPRDLWSVQTSELVRHCMA